MNTIYEVKDEVVCGKVGKITCESLSNFFEGEMFTFKLNGKEMSRRVYDDSSCGLYITVKGYKVFEYDFN